MHKFRVVSYSPNLGFFNSTIRSVQQVSLLTMFRSFCTKFIHEIPNSKTNLFISHKFNSKISNPQQSPTISYLINKCGLSLNSAISASKDLTIENTHNSDLVIQLFTNYNFTSEMITNIVIKKPKILLSDSIKTLEPKFEFWKSCGFSNQDIARLVSANFTSLNNRSVPIYTFLRKYLRTNQDVVNAFIGMQYVSGNVDDLLVAAELNINVLRDEKIPESLVQWLLIWRPKAIAVKDDRFKEIVRRIVGMKFDTHGVGFVSAIGVMGGFSDLDWKKRVEIYKSFGLSEENVIEAFKLQANFMNTSDKKIRKMMGFYVNELGMKLSDVVKHPNLMMISLEKRVIPRCSVLLLLLTKGLIKKDFQSASVLYSPNKWFEKKYVLKYQEVVPDLLNAYHGELEHPNWETVREMLQGERDEENI